MNAKKSEHDELLDAFAAEIDRLRAALVLIQHDPRVPEPIMQILQGVLSWGD